MLCQAQRTTQNSGVTNSEVQKFYGLGMGSIKSKELDDEIAENTRAPVILAMVVDKSRSMEGQKIESLKKNIKMYY